MVKEFFKTYADSVSKNLAILSTILVIFLVLVEIFNPFNLSIIEGTKDFLGINRKSAAELQEIVAGKMEGRRLLADATREYTGDFILKKTGGPFNCAGESQFINDGVGTARFVVSGDKLMFTDVDGQIVAQIPEPEFDTVDLKEDLDIKTGRNPCARVVQLFGDVTSESEVREMLRSEIENIARDDQELKKEASCNAKAEVESILEKTGTNDSNLTYVSSSGTALSCD